MVTAFEVAFLKEVAPNCTAAACKFAVNLPVLTESDNCVEYALDGYFELVAILYDAKIEELEV